VEGNEALAVEEELRAALTSAGFQWVLDQFDAVLVEGKPEFRKRERFLRDPEEVVPADLTKKRGVLTSEPYSPQERLELLITAIRRITVEPAEFEKATVDLLIRQERVARVQWVDELGREPPRDASELELSIDATRAARAQLTETLDLLSERVP
jgi:hypothetical protein